MALYNFLILDFRIDKMSNFIKKTLADYFKELANLGYEAVEWVISGAIIGTSVGLLMVAFRIALIKFSDMTAPAFNNLFSTLLLPTLGLFLAGIIIHKVPIASGHGTNHIIRAILRNKPIKIVTLPAKFIATILTLCMGGSGGREGPALQMATSIGEKVSQILKLKTIPREYVVISAVSASFGAMFHAPIAGAVFGCEVLLLRGIKYAPLLTCMFSSLFAFFISWLFQPRPLLVIPAQLLKYQISATHVPLFVVFGLMIGIVGPLYIGVFRGMQKLFDNIKIKIYFRTAIGGFLTGLVIWFVHSYTNGNYTVRGMSTMSLALILRQAWQIPISVLLIVMIGKMIATNLTVGSGASGGLVMPTLFFGACLGILLARLIGFNAIVLGATGMLGFFGAVAHVPVAMTFLAVELFNASFLLPVAIVGLIGSWILSYHSLYPAVEIPNPEAKLKI